MGSIIEHLENTFIERISDSSLFRETWNQVCKEFPPVPDFDYKNNMFPSTRLAMEAGEMGLAILWIVQFSLFRCILKDALSEIKDDHPLVSRISSVKDTTIGAMAHTEPRDNRMTIKSEESTILLNGAKRYISGGYNADVLLVTGRRPGDENYSKMVFLPVDTLPDGALVAHDLEVLYTISHGMLTLDEYRCDKDNLFPVKDKDLRKLLKRWSMVERTLIVEAYIGFMKYLAEACEKSREVKERKDEIQDMLNFHIDFSKKQLDNAWNRSFVETGGDMAGILGTTQTLVHYITHNSQDLPTEITTRARDLQLFNKLRV